MKVVGITILRMGNEDPIPVSMACDLSSYGFFQRQVREEHLKIYLSYLCLIDIICCVVVWFGDWQWKLCGLKIIESYAVYGGRNYVAFSRVVPSIRRENACIRLCQTGVGAVWRIVLRYFNIEVFIFAYCMERKL